MILFGDSTVENGNRSGVDVTLGMWLNCCNTWGIEGNYLDLGRQSASYDSGVSNGYPVLARPSYDTSLDSQDAEWVAHPSSLSPASAAG